MEIRDMFSARRVRLAILDGFMVFSVRGCAASPRDSSIFPSPPPSDAAPGVV